jgi:hypothetical protein
MTTISRHTTFFSRPTESAYLFLLVDDEDIKRAIAVFVSRLGNVQIRVTKRFGRTRKG